MDTTSTSGQALPAGTRLEEFVVERVLGSGGFGITYLARDMRLERRVVIKENLPIEFAYRDTHSLAVHPRSAAEEGAERFRWAMENFTREAAMLASLEHPGIVRVLRSFEALGAAFFVMPFVEGVEFEEWIGSRREKGEPFGEEELVGFLEHVLDALAYLHERGICHRDIKPKNILITKDGVPVLIDFGAARQRLGERSMTVLESPGYTPFEQHESRGNIGPWSDLYALAATLVKAVTFETPPKSADRLRSDRFAPLAGRPELAGRYSVALLGSIDRGFAVDEKERWQDAREWLMALEGGVEGPQVPTAATAAVSRARGADATAAPSTPGAHQPAGRPKRRRFAFAVVAAALVVGLGAGGAWWVKRRASAAGEPTGEEPAAPAAAPGGLVVTSEPSGAVVTGVDGAALGVTPVEIGDLPGGRLWKAILELEGYEPGEVEAEVVAAETKLVPPVKLRPAPQKVIVTSKPAGAEVMEDGRVVGTTPWEGTPREVGATVRIGLRKLGYGEAEVSGEVELGSTMELRATLKPLPQKVAVSSEPAGAEVVEGGKVLGVTPLEMTDVEPGTVVAYTLQLAGHEEAEVSGRVEVGRALELRTTLKLLPKLALAGTRAGEEREYAKMKFCWMPAGEFVMGSPAGEDGRDDDETQHRVKISKGFWMGKYEVTQAQWREGGGVDVSGRPPAFWEGKTQVTWERHMEIAGTTMNDFRGDDLPVDRLDWSEAKAWCEALTRRERIDGRIPDDWVFALPSEAQWEYACRAGTKSALHNGRDLASRSGACRNLDEVAWYRENSGSKPHPAGGKAGNAWGLHDMHGNVWEWCRDCYGAYPAGSIADPAGPSGGSLRVLRGGSWSRSAGSCRSADRGKASPDYRRNGLGLRLVLRPASSE